MNCWKVVWLTCSSRPACRCRRSLPCDGPPRFQAHENPFGKEFLPCADLWESPCLGMLAVQATDPPDIAGRWVGEDWGQVVLTRAADGQYSGVYSETVGKGPGKIELKWSRIERRFNGTWREGEDERFGELSIRLVGNEIRGALTTDAKSKINPATPRLADLVWTRAEATARAAAQRIAPPDRHRGRGSRKTLRWHVDRNAQRRRERDQGNS